MLGSFFSVPKYLPQTWSDLGSQSPSSVASQTCIFAYQAQSPFSGWHLRQSLPQGKQPQHYNQLKSFYDLTLLTDLHLISNQNTFLDNLSLFICANVALISKTAQACPLLLSLSAQAAIPSSPRPCFARAGGPWAGEAPRVLPRHSDHLLSTSSNWSPASLNLVEQNSIQDLSWSYPGVLYMALKIPVSPRYFLLKKAGNFFFLFTDLLLLAVLLTSPEFVISNVYYSIFYSISSNKMI